MKKATMGYWIATALVSLMMIGSALAYLSRTPMMMESFTTLGYPVSYFPMWLGIAKLLGVVVLLVPGVKILKEWAYAGFTFTFLAGIISHVTVGEAGKLIGPLLMLILLGVSYVTRPADRRILAS